MIARSMLRTTAGRLVIAVALCAALISGCDRPQERPGMAFELPADADNGPTARNIILMISDGYGFYHHEAARMYQQGAEGTGVYEQFPIKLAMSTFAAGGEYDPEKAWETFDWVKHGATDSAAAATAMAAGVKTYPGAIGVDVEKKPVTNVVERAEQTGRSTGVVTSVQLSHATPAGFVAHNENRGHYEQIATEMIRDSAVDVLMGAGHPEYDNNARRLEDGGNYKYVGGPETWQSLRAKTAGADADGDGEADPWTLITSLEEFEALATAETPARVIGIPRVATTLQQRRAFDPEKTAPFETELNEGVPTLEQMARGALNVLDEDPDGFFLMVEGGAVDWASHANQGGRMIEEQVDFNRSVEAVIEWVESNSSWDDTLLIVTADHECGYLTGPGSDPQWHAPVCHGEGVMPEVEWHSGGHTNSLVPLFARGAVAESLQSHARGEDPVWGTYTDNIDLARILFSALGSPQ